jgi:hypothetical protein
MLGLVCLFVCLFVFSFLGVGWRGYLRFREMFPTRSCSQSSLIGSLTCVLWPGRAWEVRSWVWHMRVVVVVVVSGFDAWCLMQGLCVFNYS